MFRAQFRLELLKKRGFPKEKTHQDGASLFLGKGSMVTADPVVVKHMLRTDFDAFNKFSDGELPGLVYLRCANAVPISHTYHTNSIVWPIHMPQK